MGDACSAFDDPVVERAEPEEENAPSAAFGGRWVSGRGVVHMVGLDKIRWNSGDVTKWVKRRHQGKVEWCTQLNGQLIAAHLNEHGQMVWSDGDVWTKDEVGPQTGTYQAANDALAIAQQRYETLKGSAATIASSALSVAGSSPGSPAQGLTSPQGGASSPGSAESPAAWTPSPRGPPAPGPAFTPQERGYGVAVSAGGQMPTMPGGLPMPTVAAGGYAPRPKRRVAPPGSNSPPEDGGQVEQSQGFADR